MMTDADQFAPLQPYLFALAYQMLGSASDAEDVVQDAYLRYTGAPRNDVRSPKAYLSAIVTRLCLDRLKAARATREHYIGPWLPEPVLTTDATDIHAVVEQHEAITQAFLVLLERLTPPERAVFVLREVFEYDYDDIAAMLHMSQANCRQLFHRAKEQIAAHRSRFSASSERQQELVERFLAATQHGDVQALQDVLAADVQLWADSGGKARAPQRMVQGRDALTKLFPVFTTNIVQTVGGDRTALRHVVTNVNGEPAILSWVRDELDTVLICSVEHDQITTIRLIRNPDKLAFLRRQLEDRAST
jgi:RNA polymerase sigma-70 factor (ECF subfamily)